ncbi:MAG: hydrolase [Verrucomicrobia bacterium]|nr:hydrolase [Verrucomicrobiota bacterium]
MSDHRIPRLDENACGLLVIDLQERFAPVITNWTATIQMAARLIRFFRLLRAPILATEQYPKGLGRTVPEIQAELAADAPPPIAKTIFSSCASAECRKAVETLGRRQWVLCGIETHVCVQQTAFDLLDLGCDVFLAADAVSSRHPTDRETALRRMERAGVAVSTSESLIFEALRDAAHPLFKQASALVK